MNIKIDKYKSSMCQTYLPELFKSIPPNVRFTSPPLCGRALCTTNQSKDNYK